MNGGRFEPSDIPGMRPSPEEVQRQAEVMAREMFPEKFGLPRATQPLMVFSKDGVVMLDPEEFDRRNEEAQRLGAPRPPLTMLAPPEPATEIVSPISRLFAAVRGVLDVYPLNDMSGQPNRSMQELRAAYDALKLDG